LGVGSIPKLGADSFKYRVFTVKDLAVIISHFERYPLIYQKRADYLLFKQVVELVKCKDHLTIKGLHKIVSTRASMNKGWSDELKVAFSNVTPVARPLVSDQTIKNPNWLAGFMSGEGCFFIDIAKSLSRKIGVRVQLTFKAGQHSRDAQLMGSLVSFLGCGRYYQPLGYNHGEFIVQRFFDLDEKIIPFFEKYPLVGDKRQDFSDFKKVVDIVKVKGHLTEQGLEEIRVIKAGMNRGKTLTANLKESISFYGAYETLSL